MFYKQLTDRYQHRDDSTRNLPSRWLWGTPPDVGHSLGVKKQEWHVVMLSLTLIVYNPTGTPIILGAHLERPSYGQQNHNPLARRHDALFDRTNSQTARAGEMGRLVTRSLDPTVLWQSDRTRP